MSKVILLVFIAYSDHPPVTYRMPTQGATDCYQQAAMLSKQAPPESANVVKYVIGCSFEEPAEKGFS